MKMQRNTLLGLGMLACIVLLIISVAGFANAIRPQPTVTRVPVQVAALKPATAPTPTPTLAPVSEPVTQVRVPILMYHHLKDICESDDSECQQLTVTPQDFRDQVAYLNDNGYHTITFAELLAAFDGKASLPANPVIITFDDGWDDIYHVAYPILRDHGQRATFFISTNWITNVEGVVGWDQIKEMSQGGMEFGSHSSTHPYLTESDPDALAWEIEASKAALEEHTGLPVTTMAYPFGLYDDTVIAALQAAGYRAACTIDPGVTAEAGKLMLLPRTWVYGWLDLEDFEALLKSS